MTGLFYPHPHSLLLPIFFIALHAAAQSSNPISPHCLPRYCGDVLISYPFWIIDTESTTQYCGYEGFGINCPAIGDGILPEITLGGDLYYVRWINQDSILLSDSNVSLAVPGPPKPNHCPRVRHGINLQTLPLNFTTSNTNLSFHFNCTRCPSFATEIQMPCFFERNERKACVHVMNTITEEAEYSCTEKVVTTVVHAHINEFPNLSMQLGDILPKGFELEWSRMDGCEKCEESDGRCGWHNTTGLICFCSDGMNSRGECKGTFVTTPVFTVKKKVHIGDGYIMSQT
ncbi:putative transcription factor interactor and regulator LIM family [Helianthus annuus]|nr:putative transcription factor interactor and regulator LIM family [Helianthus annuus]